MRHIEKRYLRELIPATLGYVVVLFISIGWLRWYGAGLPLIARIALALAPMVPVGLIARAIVRVIRDGDEFERMLQLQAAAIAGLAVGLGYLSLGLLAKAKLFQLDGLEMAIWVFPSLCVGFGFAKCWLSWRYRG